MPKVPFKSEKAGQDDEDYEIVSFEDFCDKSPGSKTDLLTLNDNINYRLYYEKDNGTKFVAKDGTIFKDSVDLKDVVETSLGEENKLNFKNKSSTFSPFGRYNPNSAKNSLFGNVIQKPNTDGEPIRENRYYQRFSPPGSLYQRLTEVCQRFGSTMLLLTFVLALSLGVWWAVCNTVGAGGDRYYRKLWERAHMEIVTLPPTDKVVTEYHYHDHNNLSTKNKLNATEKFRKKPDLNKKSTYTERPLATLAGLCARVAPDMRFDCHPQGGASEEACIKRGCCWNGTESASPIGRPYCFYPPQYDTYHFLNMTENRHGLTVYYDKLRPSGYPDDFDTVRVDFKYLSNDVMQVKIYDADNKRFEPPYPEVPMITGPINNMRYRVLVDSAVTGFKVIRNEDNVTVLDTQNVGGLILSDKFLQISTLLPTNKLYGLGEKQASFRLDMDWEIYTMFNFDSPPFENTNLYGSQPFYLALEDNGKSHGLVLLNSNAIDVVVQPTPAITYRTIGGVLNFFLMLGPSPGDVISQYMSLIGRPFMPPYWGLGFQLCKYNYGSLNVTRDVWEKNRNAGIPFDVQWNDIDYMKNSNDFTYDTVKFAGLPQFVDKLHKSGMHYVVLVDPGISGSENPGEYPPYDRGLELDIFIKNSTNHPFVGKVWNKQSTVWPDFTHPSSTAYWVEMMTALHDKIPFDGAWIDMNEPSNFLSGSMYGNCAPEDLPYSPSHIGQDGLKTKTLCMDAKHYAGIHYDWHNLYSITETIATNFAMTEIRGKRPFIISRSTFIGSGHYAGHWSGDINSDWHDMRMTIPELLSFSLFGIPLMGADICGFRGNATEELCLRWHQLGAFYPFSRNHNSDTSIPQDPVSMGDRVVKATREALYIRYSLLPYYYTMFWKAHTQGHTVARPLFFEYPGDQITHDIDTQFLIGPNVMIAPILEQNTTSTKAYLPGDQQWLVLAKEKMVPSKYTILSEDETVLIRAGSIITLQRPPLHGVVNTANSRSGPLQLAVYQDKQGQARGELYWDDGDSLNSYEEKKFTHIEFSTSSGLLEGSVRWWGYGVPSVNNITVYAVNVNVKTVALNDKPCKMPLCEFYYDASSRILRVFNTNLSLDKKFTLAWTKFKKIQIRNKQFEGENRR